MHVYATGFSIPKMGNIKEENDDAFCPINPLDTYGEIFRFALADGATESPLSNQWARYLTETVCLKDENIEVNDIISGWQNKRDEYVEAKYKDGKPKQWWEEIINNSPSYSTLLYLILKDSGDFGSWNAYAVGDSCLFQIRNKALIFKFPIESSNDFGNRPFLISSDQSSNNRLDDFKKTYIGTWQRGDRFYLMTDALAHWFIEMEETGTYPWTMLGEFQEPDTQLKFEEYIDLLRERRKIKNDDTTLISIYID